MLDRVKRVLVESFVGAIALGYLLAQAILAFVNIFASPIEGWLSQNYVRDVTSRTTVAPLSPLYFAFPQLVTFVVLLLAWYVLLRWLYFTPLESQASGASLDAQESA
jgi:hypothetical protein